MIYKKRGHGILKEDDTRAKKTIARAKLTKVSDDELIFCKIM